MKKSLLFVAAAAMFIFVGCKKEQQPTQELKSNDVIHINIGQIESGTKVVADDITANTLTFKWEEGDEVVFADRNYDKVKTYTCTDPANGTFESSDGVELATDGRYYLCYPSQRLEVNKGAILQQTYRVNQLPREHCISNQVSGGDKNFTLSDHSTVLHFKVKGNAILGSIEHQYILPMVGELRTYTILSCGDGVQLDPTTPTDFYIDATVIVGAGFKLIFKDTSGKIIATKETTKDFIQYSGKLLDFATPIEVNASSIPDGALPGVFSVSATKKVHFSRGNLYAQKTGDNWTWNFYDEQYKYNSIATSSGKRTANANDTEIDLFTWGYDNTSTNNSYSLNPVNTAGISGHTTDGETFNPEEDWGSQIGDGSTWRTLSTAEWKYLFAWTESGANTDTSSPRYNLYKYVVTVCDKTNCVVLLPDGWEWKGEVGTGWQTEYPVESTQASPVTWQKMQAAGAVCLPAAGHRNRSNVSQVGNDGRYWSSTGNGKTGAYRVSFSSSGVSPSNNDGRFYGYSVRLITDASAAPTPAATKGTAKRTGDIDVNWVQLWENGPKFAEYNVGVTDGNAERNGGYYAWGGSQDKVDDHNTTNTGSGNLTGIDDTATKLWGSNWRMPTQAELENLLNSTNCTVEWTTVGGKYGRKFTGKGAYASNSVFLPAAGLCSGAVDGYGFCGFYWSSTPNGSNNAYSLFFVSDNQSVGAYDRGTRYSVRAVLAE